MKRLFMLFSTLITIAMLVSPLATAQSTSAAVPPCQSSAFLDNATTTTRLVVAPPTQTITVSGVSTSIAQKRIHICHITFRVKQGGSPANFGLVTGTGSNCGTGTANLSPQWVGTASVTDFQSLNYGSDGAIQVPSAKDLCFALSATPTQGQVSISYTIY